MENNIKEFLKAMTTFPKYNLSAEDNKAIENSKAHWMTRKITRKKFRKTKINKNTFDEIQKKIENSIEEKRPIHFNILFGGYKHFWNDSHPYPDWAEVFNLKFMSELISPILEVYEPGVELDYSSEDIILPYMNNYPIKALDEYAKSFKKLIEFYSKNIPKNFKINYIRTGEMYNREKLIETIFKKLPKVKKEWEKISKKEKDILLHRSHRSVMWNGYKNLTNLNDKEKLKKIEESKQIEDIFYEEEDKLIGEYSYGANNIPIVLSWGLSDENIDNWLTLGSTFASSVDFWIGKGILEKRENKLIPRIISKNQYNEIKEKLTLVDTGINNLKNLNSIEVCKDIINFK